MASRCTREIAAEFENSVQFYSIAKIVVPADPGDSPPARAPSLDRRRNLPQAGAKLDSNATGLSPASAGGTAPGCVIGKRTDRYGDDPWPANRPESASSR